MAREIHNAIVLRRSDWRDYDRMLTLLTPEGRIDAVARGCRRPKSPLLSAAEPFTAGEYTLYKSISHYQVEQYRSTDTFYPLREDYERLTHAAYYLRLAEMISLPDQPCRPLFDMLLRALAHITYGETAPEIVTMAFELHLLASLGLSPSMDRCVRCGVQVDSAAWFDAEGGGVVCEKCKKALPDISNGARRIMMRVPMTRFDALSKLTGHPDAPEAALFTRRFISLRPEMHVPSAPDIREIF
ncbi:MAG: DNA repair protein RecO [Clostridia bacterium]|nr:DNA repair protein RecO [Clostridia bacterium]